MTDVTPRMIAKIVEHASDAELWRIVNIVVRHAAMRAHKRGLQGIETACTGFIKTMRAVGAYDTPNQGKFDD